MTQRVLPEVRASPCLASFSMMVPLMGEVMV